MRNGATYELQTYLKPRPGTFDSIIAGDHFGSSLALAADGQTLVVGAPLAEAGIQTVRLRRRRRLRVHA